MLRRLRAALVVAAVAVVPLAALAPDGAAVPTAAQPAAVGMAASGRAPAGLMAGEDPFEGDCAGLPPKVILRLYEVQGRNFLIPLRCGFHNDATGDGFGYRHIKARHGFDVTEEFWMKSGLRNPDEVVPRGTPTSWRYIIYVDARELVIGWDGRHEYAGDEHPQKGIITCFYRIHT